MLLPTPENASVLFLDLQDEIVKNSQTVGLRQLRRTAGVLAKLAVLHKLPAFLSAVQPGGDFLDEVLEPLGRPEPRMRTATSAFADAGLLESLKATNRQVLVLAGVASEIVVQRTALDGLAAGFTVHVAVDACGGISPRTEDAAWRRIIDAGGVTTSVTTFVAELVGNFTAPLGGQTLALMYETLSG